MYVYTNVRNASAADPFNTLMLWNKEYDTSTCSAQYVNVSITPSRILMGSGMMNFSKVNAAGTLEGDSISEPIISTNNEARTPMRLSSSLAPSI